MRLAGWGEVAMRIQPRAPGMQEATIVLLGPNLPPLYPPTRFPRITPIIKLLAKNGTAGAPIILIGSSYSSPGRHAWRHPLYSISKSMIPTLVKVLANELAYYDRRSIGVKFDVLDGGMSGKISRRKRVVQEDRLPFGTIPTMEEAADQIMWVLDNQQNLITGATIELASAAIP